MAAARDDNVEMLEEIFKQGGFDINYQDGCVNCYALECNGLTFVQDWETQVRVGVDRVSDAYPTLSRLRSPTRRVRPHFPLKVPSLHRRQCIARLDGRPRAHPLP